jgi:PAS domain S-box-containing protein
MYETTFIALFEHASIGIIISSENGRILRSNPFSSQIFGYDDKELDGQHIEVLLPENLRHSHIEFRKKYIEHPQNRVMGSNLNLLALKKNGTQFPVEISLTFFEIDGQKQFVSFVIDITERKNAQMKLLKLAEELESKVVERTKELSDALLELNHTNDGLHLEMDQKQKVEEQIRRMLAKEKELNELKSRFVSMASHEFRTPLAGILTSVSLIGKYSQVEEEPKRQRHILNIKKSVKTLTTILNDFLSIDKLDQGMVSSKSSHFDFNSLIQETIDELRETTMLRHQISVDLGIEEISVFQDREMIHHVVVNLISNALKYSPEGSTITIRTSAAESTVTLEVQDQGMGIPLEDQPYLFGQFFRAQNVTNLQGTGLGLNIVKRYLDLMDGSIGFVSVENIGTTFTVVLPLEKT